MAFFSFKLFPKYGKQLAVLHYTNKLVCDKKKKPTTIISRLKRGKWKKCSNAFRLFLEKGKVSDNIICFVNLITHIEISRLLNKMIKNSSSFSLKKLHKIYWKENQPIKKKIKR